MAFTPTSGVGGYVGTPRPKRPYTRGPKVPAAGYATAVHTRLPKQVDQPATSQPAATPQAPTGAAPARSSAEAASQANALGAQADGLEAYLAGITDPAERAYVAAQIGPKIAMLRAQQAALANQVAQEQAAIQALNSAMGSALKGLLGGVGGAYDKISGIQVGSGKAEAKGMKGVGGDVNAENAAILGALGAPSGQISELADASRATFTTGGKVLQGIGGTIPAWATDLTGQGVEDWAAAQPGVASAYANEAMRSVNADAAQSWQSTQNDLTGIYGDIPGIRQDYADQQEADWTKRFSQATQLYNMGMLTQRQFATMIGLPGADSYPDTTKPSGSTHLVPFSTPTGAKGLYNPETGKSTIIPGSGGRPPKEPTPKAWQAKNYGGHLYLFNPNDGTWHDPATKKIVVPTVGTKAAGPPTPDLSKSVALGRWVDSHLRPIPGLADTPVPPRWKPTTGKPGGTGTTTKASQAEINGAMKILNDGYLHVPGRHVRLSQDQPGLQRIFNLHKAALTKNGIKSWQELRDALPTFTPQNLSDLGIQGSVRNPQDVYMDMIHRGMSAYQAWTNVRKYWPTWGEGYFPKGDPAAKTAGTPGATAAPISKWVSVRPGADRSGYATHQPVLQFVAQIGQVHGAPLTVTTGTDHNQYVAGEGNTQSAHWTGWAVDLALNNNPPGVVSPEVTRLGQDALIAAGMPEAQARQVTHWDGGNYNGYNILFNTTVGGNHYNHVHVGLRPPRQNDTGGNAPWYRKGSPESTNPASAPYNVDAARTPQGAIGAAKAMAYNKGWSGKEWTALYSLWSNESGFKYQISNQQGSGAVGIPQRMPSSHPITDDYLTNPITQIKWGLDYIKGRYKTPTRAWAFWRATVNRNASLAPPDLRRMAQTWISNGWGGY